MLVEGVARSVGMAVSGASPKMGAAIDIAGAVVDGVAVGGAAVVIVAARTTGVCIIVAVVVGGAEGGAAVKMGAATGADAAAAVGGVLAAGAEVTTVGSTAANMGVGVGIALLPRRIMREDESGSFISASFGGIFMFSS